MVEDALTGIPAAISHLGCSYGSETSGLVLAAWKALCVLFWHCIPLHSTVYTETSNILTNRESKLDETMWSVQFMIRLLELRGAEQGCISFKTNLSETNTYDWVEILHFSPMPEKGAFCLCEEFDKMMEKLFVIAGGRRGQVQSSDGLNKWNTCVHLL